MWDAQTIETGVLEEFAGLCRIPHPSGQEKAIAQHLTSQLEALGFSPMLDHAGNLLCDIPGSAGPQFIGCRLWYRSVRHYVSSAGAAASRPSSDHLHG